MRIVVQCCAKKRGGHVRRSNGTPVNFVAHPEYAVGSDLESHVHPDGPRDELNDSWRDFLSEYNESGQNPLGLMKAWQLYMPAKHRIYERLVDRFRECNVFICSAGWGLIQSTFLTPYYDVTFSGKEKDRYRRQLIQRKKNDRFDDYNHLAPALGPNESVYLFLTNAYLPPYWDLMGTAGAVWNAAEMYSGRKYTNWHYDYINELLNQREWPTI